MSNRMTIALASFVLRAIRPKREPDFLIGPTKENPYMRRWWILPRNHKFNIYLHHMLHDDDDSAPHDHPWWSLSLCLSGPILEYEYNKNQLITINRIVKGDFKWRSNTYTHRLELPEGEAWTLFITGPKVRIWGFHCPKGFIPWHDFVDSKDPGQPGRGCGELE